MALPRLTAWENELLPLLLRGMTDKEIADSLVLSPHTVRNHVRAILRKFGVDRRGQLSLAVIALQRQRKKRLDLEGLGWTKPKK